MNKDAIIERQANENLKLVNDNKELLQRIDNAIEYIENRITKEDLMLKIDTKMVREELLFILRGKNDE